MYSKYGLESIRLEKLADEARINNDRLLEAEDYLEELITSFNEKLSNKNFTVYVRDFYIPQPNKYIFFKQPLLNKPYNEIVLTIEVDPIEFSEKTKYISMKAIENYIDGYYDKYYLAICRIEYGMNFDGMKCIDLRLIPRN